MTRAQVRTRIAERREKDEAFYREFDAYMLECFKKPGFKLETEMQLAARFGVTRYKVRKALERLNRSGVLTRKKHAGSVVNNVRAESVRDHMEEQLNVAGCLDEEYADAALWLYSGLVPGLCDSVTAVILAELGQAARRVSDAADGVQAREAAADFLVTLARVRGNRLAVIFCGVLESRLRKDARPFDAEAVTEKLLDFVKALKKDKPRKAAGELEDALRILFA